jgi:uncharacterized protein YjdB
MVTGVKLNHTSLDLRINGAAGADTGTLSATVNPDKEAATDEDVSWESDDEKVATVENGVVTAVGKGTATITATTVGKKADGQPATATCDVTVTVLVTGVTLNKTTLPLTINGAVIGTETLAAAVNPTGATNTNVSWSSSHENIARVNNGVVTAVASGTAIITVTTAGLKANDQPATATCTVTVTVLVTGVTLPETLALTINGAVIGTGTLSATVLPAGATNKTVSWSSGDEKVATVSSTGLVTAVGNGTATITATTQDGNKTATCAVTVTVLVTGVTLTPSALELIVGGEGGNTGNLSVTVQPAGATDQRVSWKTSDAGVATVNSGLVTAVAPGTAKITVTTTDGNKTATCTVTVRRSVPFTINIADAAPVIEGPTISRSGTGYEKTKKREVTNASDYSSIEWHITGAYIGGSPFVVTGASITLDSGNSAYNRIGEHFITLEVVKNGVPYNRTVTFTVVN